MFLYFLLALLKNIDAEEEIKLLERIAAKNQNALENLYVLYSRIIYSVVIRIVKNQEDAEEVLQNIFLQVWEKAGSFNKHKGTVYAWLMTMARNKAIDKIRSADHKKNSGTFTFDEKIEIWENENSMLAIDAAAAAERSEYVKKALYNLPDEQRLVIEMAFFDGYTQKEISEKLKLPLGTIKTRSRQGMIKLQNLLKDYL